MASAFGPPVGADVEDVLNFLVFCVFNLSLVLPDSIPFYRFCNCLLTAQLYITLRLEVNQQLEALALKVNGARGVMVGASIIESTAKPKRTADVSVKSTVSLRDSTDTQAPWVKKGRHDFYAYLADMAVDPEDGFIGTSFAKLANASEN